jgi:membrane-associated phospholipid phosphatase
MFKDQRSLFDADTGAFTGRGLAVVTLAGFAMIVLSIAFVDRPVADFAHGLRLSDGKAHPVFIGMTWVVDPVPIVGGLVTGAYVIAALLGHRPGPKGQIALKIALAIMVAITLKEQLKFLTGRTWPETWTANNPSYIKDGVYGFFPWAAWTAKGAGRGYLSFPSGHMTMVSVAATALALQWPRWRWLASVPMLIVFIGMVGANYHWVSDLIAGAMLGAAIALAAHRFGGR